MTQQTLANISTAITLMLFMLLFFKAFIHVMQQRKEPSVDIAESVEIYAVANEDDFIKADFVMRKNKALIFEKDKQLFAVGLPDNFKQKFVKGQTYRIGKSEDGSITILK